MTPTQRQAIEAAQYEIQNYLAAVNAGASKQDTNGLQIVLPTIQAALAEPEQEPVAVVRRCRVDGQIIEGNNDEISCNLPLGTQLYTSPQPREWQELSEEEIENATATAGRSFRWHTGRVRGQMMSPLDVFETHLVNEISAALRAKNGGA